MNLAQLKAIAAAYHQKQITDLQIGAVDLFLVAANNARRKGEMLHNFEYARCSATLSIDGITGGDIRNATINEPGFSTIKEITNIQGLRNNTEYIPVDYTRLDMAIERKREAIEVNSYYWRGYGYRYPGDAEWQFRTSRGAITQRGHILLPFPTATAATDTPWTAYIEAYGWLLDYTDADLAIDIETAPPKDFFIDQGFAYMQWATIIELNNLFSTFVPRQEGNVGVPKDQLDNAWRDFVVWDSYIVNENMTVNA
jgi:hypothetical protein